MKIRTGRTQRKLAKTNMATIVKDVPPEGHPFIVGGRDALSGKYLWQVRNAPSDALHGDHIYVVGGEDSDPQTLDTIEIISGDRWDRLKSHNTPLFDTYH